MTSQIQIGPLTIHIYGLIIAFAIILGWLIAKRRAQFYRIKPYLLDSPLLFLPLVLAIVGARAYHVIDYWPDYQNNPLRIFAIASGGLGIFGALVGIFIGLGIFAKVKRINYLSLLDLTAPSLILGQAIGRIGNFVNQEGYGLPTNLPWGVYIDQAHRPVQYLFSTHFHPTFFYEATLELIAFFILIYFGRRPYSSSERSESRSNVILRPKAEGSSRSSRGFSLEEFFASLRMTSSKFSLRSNNKQSGQLFAWYLILYGLSRGVTEFWRIDTAKVGEIKLAYLLSLLLILIGIRLLSLRAKRSNLTN